ncbi:hypothetical protein PIB30_115366, partial [Stylosanthes scabra]|nr:hypothetical protein [Stylosanthes scabra]
MSGCGRLGMARLLNRTKLCAASARGVPCQPEYGMRWIWLSGRRRDADYADRRATLGPDARMQRIRRTISA